MPVSASRTTTTAPTATAAPKTWRSTGWLLGCLAGACLLLSAAGVSLVALNWQNLMPTDPPTDVPTQLPTSVPTLVPTDVPLPNETGTPISVGSVLLNDDFSSSNWGQGTDSDSSVEYAGEA
jgi:hypothetical protein